MERRKNEIMDKWNVGVKKMIDCLNDWRKRIKERWKNGIMDDGVKE